MTNKLNGQKNIYNIIRKEKLDVVSKPIAKAHGLPNECYNNSDYTKIERKKLFEDKWVVIGVASSIPNPVPIRRRIRRRFRWGLRPPQPNMGRVWGGEAPRESRGFKGR